MTDLQKGHDNGSFISEFKNPSILELLKEGCLVQFPDEFFLAGLPKLDKIEVGHKLLGTIDYWSLDRIGLKTALARLEFEQEQVAVQNGKQGSLI